MHKTLTIKEYNRLTDEYDKVKYRCKCGRRNIIPYNVDKVICTWCGNYCFKSKQDEFRFRLEEQRKKGGMDERKNN